MAFSRFFDEMMGGKIEIVFQDIEGVLAQSIFHELYEEGLKLQKIFNLYDKSSELSLLNKKREILASDDLIYLLKLALKYCDITNGAYDISIGKNILDRKNRNSEVIIKCSYKNIVIDGNKVSLKHPDVLIDLGSIAKGYIVDKLAESALEKGIISGYINARGDIRVFGDKTQKVAIQDPRNKGKLMCEVMLKNSAIATSGDYNQYHGNYDNCHIIGKKDLVSVSVVSNKCVVSDVLATCIFVMDKKEREKLIKSIPSVKVLCVDTSLKPQEYNGFGGLKQIKND